MNITIHPEARAAALRAVAHMMTYKATKREGWTVGELCDAACITMLKAWPGMTRHTWPESGSGDDYTPAIDEIILPLPESTNVEV